MRSRPINLTEATMVLNILRHECGYKIDNHEVDNFLRNIMEGCQEWRFMGALGFGGKFRNNGNNDNTPYVDCYPESRTPERDTMIAKANERLAQLFQ